MKIVAISDTHGSDFINKIPECDLLLIAGDISPIRLSHSFYLQRNWFSETFILQLILLKDKAKNVIFIAGNHDKYLEEMNKSNRNKEISDLLPSNIYYLCDEVMEIGGIRIYGSPWCNLPFWASKGSSVWNFAEEEIDLGQIYKKIPTDIDILITHGPVYGYCDTILEGSNANSSENLGSKALREYINTSKATHIFSGHIHSAQRKMEVIGNNITKYFSCVSILNEEYKLTEKYTPIEVQYGD